MIVNAVKEILEKGELEESVFECPSWDNAQVCAGL